MTIETSLRRRATRARQLALVWLLLAVTVLIGTYVSLPSVAHKTLLHVVQIEAGHPASSGEAGTVSPEGGRLLRAQVFTLGTLTLGVFAVSFACYLLGRSAYVEMGMAARCVGLADALCLAGDDFERLQKAAELLVPRMKHFAIPELFSDKDRESLFEILKLLRKG